MLLWEIKQLIFKRNFLYETDTKQRTQPGMLKLVAATLSVRWMFLPTETAFACTSCDTSYFNNGYLQAHSERALGHQLPSASSLYHNI